MKTSAHIRPSRGRRRRDLHGILYGCGACLLGSILTLSQAEAARYDFIAEESSLNVWVPRAGILKFVGHDHTIEARKFDGSLEWDASEPDEATLSLEVPVSELRVLETKDREKIDAEMRGPAVLDESTHPSIGFVSTAITPREAGVWDVRGTLAVRGIEREVTFPAEVTFSEDGRVVATGAASLKPATFGIEPVTALAGAVRTSDSIEVRFTIYGKSTGN